MVELLVGMSAIIVFLSMLELLLVAIGAPFRISAWLRRRIRIQGFWRHQEGLSWKESYQREKARLETKRAEKSKAEHDQCQGLLRDMFPEDADLFPDSPRAKPHRH